MVGGFLIASEMRKPHVSHIGHARLPGPKRMEHRQGDRRREESGKFCVFVRIPEYAKDMKGSLVSQNGEPHFIGVGAGSSARSTEPATNIA